MLRRRKSFPEGIQELYFRAKTWIVPSSNLLLVRFKSPIQFAKKLSVNWTLSKGLGARALGGEAEELGLLQLGEGKAFRRTQLNVPLIPTER